MSDVRLKDMNGEQIGIMPFKEALQMAKDRGLDLIEVNKEISPQIFKLGDRKKEEYLRKKAKKDMEKKNRENARKSEEKTITFGPNIGDNDFNVKLNKVPDWFNEGHSVKIVVQFRGREVSHKAVAIPRISDMINNKMTEFGGVLKSQPSDNGRDWTVQYVKASCKKELAGKGNVNAEA